MDNNGGKSALGLDVNVAAGLANIPFICLIGVIFSIIILVTDKTNKLARFHAFQSILLHALAVVLYVIGICIALAGMAANSGLIAMLGILIYLGIFVVFVVLVVCMIMAFQGKMFKIPVIGGMADNWSN
jgi:uncharacterized membrane protein